MKKKKVQWSFPGCLFFFFFFFFYQKTRKYLKSNLVLVDIIVYESEGLFYFTLWVDLVRKDRLKTQKLPGKEFRLDEKLSRVSGVLCHLLMKIISFTMAGASFSTNIFFSIHSAEN